MARIALACSSSTSSSSMRPVRASSTVGRPADERDDLVERVEGLEVAAQDVRVGLGLAQAELRAADDDLDLVRRPTPR